MSALIDTLPDLIARYGYWFVAVIVALESMGIPLPGETTLVIAAIYAGTTHRLDIGLVVAAAAGGAILGDNAGFWLGRHIGFPLALTYGRFIRLTEGRLKLGQYLFLRHGGKVVFFGRFVALLRILAAFLAGVNRMPFLKFLVFNASGGIVWAALFGFGAYLLGDEVHRLFGPLGIFALVAAAAVMVGGGLFVRRHEARLQLEAERALPGPLDRPADL
ncbi:MAG: DedA family protein [Rhodospirillaceae bacterium]